MCSLIRKKEKLHFLGLWEIFFLLRYFFWLCQSKKKNEFFFIDVTPDRKEKIKKRIAIKKKE
jgi:hypothetical protein